MRSAVKNRVHAILAKHGITPSTPTCSAKAAARSSPTCELRDAPRRRLDSLIALIERLRPRDRRDHPRDRPARQGRRPRRRAHPDPRRRPLHRDADHRRGRRRSTASRRPASLRLGRPDPDGPQLRRQSPPGAHLPARLAGAALGAGRSRTENHHRRRPAARAIRADRQTPRRARSPRSPSPGRSSPSATTACATERSVA